jgi:hypothetical protein
MPSVDRDTVAALIRNPDTRATTLHAIALLVFKDGLYGENPPEPLEVFVGIEDEFHANLPEENENKLQAILLAVGTNAFYDDPAAFTAICETLTTGELEGTLTGDAEAVTSLEALWAVYEIGVNRDDGPEFSPSVMRLLTEIQDRFAQDPENEQGVYDPTDQQIAYVRGMRELLAAELMALGATEQDLLTELPDPEIVLAV